MEETVFIKKKKVIRQQIKKKKPFNLIGDIENLKQKLKIKELNLTNNFSSSNIKKKKELLIPLKINKKKIIKNAHILNDISNIEKPKNNKKYFITNQELSEADFRDYPYKIKKNENNKSIDKKNETESKDESDDNDLNNRDNDIEKTIKRNFILQNIDLDKFTGSESRSFQACLYP